MDCSLPLVIIYKPNLFNIKNQLFPVEIWKPHRKLIAPTFNQKILDGFVEVSREQADVFVEVLNEYVGKKDFDCFHIISNCTLDTICGEYISLIIIDEKSITKEKL